MVGNQAFFDVRLHCSVAFSLALSYYVALLISSDRRERTCLVLWNTSRSLIPETGLIDNIINFCLI